MITLLLATALLSQGPSVPIDKLTPAGYYQLLLQARKDFASASFEKAAAEFERLAAQSPESGEAWLSLGNCYYSLHQPAKAIEPYKRSLDLGFGSVENTAYNIGCCYALAGDKEQAIDWVRRALAMRFEQRSLIQKDTDLVSLHNDPRFPQLAGLAPNTEATREARWRYDIDFLVGEMKRMHYRWSVEGLPTAVTQGAAKLKSEVPKLSDSEVMVRLQKLMRMLDDGHTTMYPISSTVPVKHLPVVFYKFVEGTYIVEAAKDQTNLIGSRVVAIGNKPIDEIWTRLGDYVSRDNDKGIEWIGPQFLELTAVLKDLGAASSEDRASLRLADQEGKERTVELAAAPLDATFLRHKLHPAAQESAPLYLRHVDDSYWTQPMPEAKALYFQFNSVQNKPTESLPAFGVRLRKELAEHPVENLIVDIRHNNGGNSDLEPELIRTLIGFSAQGGRIFLITGRNTFSAAQNFENDIVRMAKPIVVGEPSSSKPFFIGESAEFDLPYSHFHGSISTRLHTVNAQDRRVWIAPDLPVPVTAADYFGNRDAAMEAILDVIKGA